MKLEKAFSEEIKLRITAQEADKMFAEKKIKSKFKFRCPSENCDAKVTCANLDRPKGLRKRNPYYKVVGKHSLRCDIAKGIETKKKHSRVADKESYRRINVQPESTRRPEPVGNVQGANNVEERARLDNNPESGGDKKIPEVRLTKLVDEYSDFLDGRLDKKDIGLIELFEARLVEIDVLFVEINGQDLSELENEPRVYWGKAWFNEVKGGYNVVFNKKLTSVRHNISRQPSALMKIDMLESLEGKHLNINTVKKMANEKPKKPKIVYLVSEKPPYVKKGLSKKPPYVEKDYINIKFEGPAYLVYRELPLK